MIRLTSYFSVEEGATVLGISNTYPDRFKGIATIEALVPRWSDVNGFRNGSLSWYSYVAGYRHTLSVRWPSVKAWLMSIDADQDMTLCCWCRDPNRCHRSLVAAMIRKWRPDIPVEVS